MFTNYDQYIQLDKHIAQKIMYKTTWTSDNKIIHIIYNKILHVHEMNRLQGQNYSDW